MGYSRKWAEGTIGGDALGFAVGWWGEKREELRGTWAFDVSGTSGALESLELSLI